MKQLNEIKRMQQLAGIINENQVTEDANGMSDPEAAASIVAQKYSTELELDKDFENKAIRLAGKEMIASGMSKVAVGNLLSGYGPFEDWFSDYITALAKELKQDGPEPTQQDIDDETAADQFDPNR